MAAELIRSPATGQGGTGLAEVPDYADLARQIRGLREDYRSDPESPFGQESWNLMADLVEEEGDALVTALEAYRAVSSGLYRVGRRVGRTVYQGDRPLFMAESEALATDLVRVLNAGAAALRQAPGAGDRDGVEAAALAMREACLKAVESHTYRGQGTEGRNDLIGMFARGNLRCKQALAKAIRALPLPTGRTGGGEGETQGRALRDGLLPSGPDPSVPVPPDGDPSRDVRSIYVECHCQRDIVASLYDAWEKLPCCSLLSVVAGAIQEIQALRGVAASGIEAAGAAGTQGGPAVGESPAPAGRMLDTPVAAPPDASTRQTEGHRGEGEDGL